MERFNVMYNNSDVIVVDDTIENGDVKYHKSIGFQVYKSTSSEEHADILAEEACYM